MIHRTHRGKIGRLSRKLREELNHRLEDGAPDVLAWLNALPEVQAMLAAQFGGSPINAQNLSNWRQGGYLEWLQQQEQRDLVRKLAENANELAADAGGVEVGNHLSVVLVAELAASAREALAGLTDPAERCTRLQELLKTLARVRQQDYLAGRLAIERERRARQRLEELAADEDRRKCQEEAWPLIQGLRRSAMTDLFAMPDFTSQALGMEAAESLLRGSCPNGATIRDHGKFKAIQSNSRLIKLKKRQQDVLVPGLGTL